MHKIAFFLSMVLLLTTNLYAQKIGYGVKVGLNFADLSGDDKGNTEGKVGFAAGGKVHIMFLEKIGAEVELLYSTKGAGGTGDNLSLNYFEIPILLRGMITQSVFVNAGVAPAFLLSAKVGSRNAEDAYKDSDLGWTAGIGSQLKQGLTLGIRYTGSLSTIAEPTDLGIFGGKQERDLKNSVFQIYFVFPIGGK